ncbi:hypothetical protein EP7_004298 [Isosphaeraceae bacterium EP7]
MKDELAELRAWVEQKRRETYPHEIRHLTLLSTLHRIDEMIAKREVSTESTRPEDMSKKTANVDMKISVLSTAQAEEALRQHPGTLEAMNRNGLRWRYSDGFEFWSTADGGCWQSNFMTMECLPADFEPYTITRSGRTHPAPAESSAGEMPELPEAMARYWSVQPSNKSGPLHDRILLAEVRKIADERIAAAIETSEIDNRAAVDMVRQEIAAALRGASIEVTNPNGESILQERIRIVPGDA